MGGSLLRRPSFRWLWLGQTLLFGGVPFWFVAVTWQMLQRTGSGTALLLLALMGFVQVRPRLAAAAPAQSGAWCRACGRGSPSPGATGRSARGWC
jgi:hypothetical protein